MGIRLAKKSSMKRVLLLVSTLVLVSAILVSWFAYYNYRLSESELDKRLEKAIDFLLIQYTPQLRLCCEAPYVAPNTYWLASDNLLAYHALEPYYPNISMTVYLELEGRDGLKSELYETLFGESVPLPIKEKVTYVIEQHDNYVIKTDVHNCTSAFPYWDEYANLLICSALSLHWEGNHTGALRLFDKAVGMWDGKGLRDRAIEEAEENLLGLYETYKLALLLYASRILQRPLPFRSQLESVLWTTQRVSDGGMVTHYNGSTTPITPIGDANTETTSLTIIAYRYTPTTNSYSFPSLGTQCCACRDGAESLRRFYRLFLHEPSKSSLII